MALRPFLGFCCSTQLCWSTGEPKLILTDGILASRSQFQQLLCYIGLFGSLQLTWGQGAIMWNQIEWFTTKYAPLRTAADSSLHQIDPSLDFINIIIVNWSVTVKRRFGLQSVFPRWFGVRKVSKSHWLDRYKSVLCVDTGGATRSTSRASSPMTKCVWRGLGRSDVTCSFLPSLRWSSSLMLSMIL